MTQWLKVAALTALTVAALQVLPAAAATVVLNGSGTMAETYQFTNPTGSGNVMTSANDYALAVPGNYSFLDTFSAPQANPLQNATGTYGFQDTYQFAITAGANGDTLVASLSCCTTPEQSGGTSIYNISGLAFRLYEVPLGTQPTVGPIPAGATLVTAWMGVASNGSTVASFSNLQAGEYFLDITGTANGTSGGSYVGSLQMSPVPLPAALPLLVSALGLFGVGIRRRPA